MIGYPGPTRETPSIILAISARYSNKTRWLPLTWHSALSCPKRVLPSLFVKWFWSHVDAIRPTDGGRIWVDSNLSKKGRIAKWLKNTLPLSRGEVDITHSAIVEEQAQAIVSNDRDTGDSRQMRHTSMLWQRCNWQERLRPTGALPVDQYLVPMQGKPLPNEPQRLRLEDPR